MKVNSNQNNLQFKGFYNNNILKKGLKFAADNGALFAATTTLVLSTGVRPFSILLTPKTDKKNKKVACAKSITSTAIGYLIMLAVSRPVSKSIKKIDTNPQKYLTKETINVLKEKETELTKTKNYKFATQIFKLGLGMVIAMPKAILTALGMPFVMKNVFNFSGTDKSENVNFKGSKDKLSKGIGNIINKKRFKNFVKKYADSNFPMHISAITDCISTGTFIGQIQSNKNLDEKYKKPLIVNSIISTALSIIAGYCADKALDKPTQKFIKKFKNANRNDSNLDKYIEGIKIAKPILILGVIYYAIIPVLSTFFADRIGKKSN